MEILEPVEELSDAIKNLAPKEDQESGAPQKLDDSAENLAKMLGRQRVTYEPVWQAVEKAGGKWVPVMCNSYRRALLLASSAMQHRTLPLDVLRRGRLVCIRLMPDANEHERTARVAHV